MPQEYLRKSYMLEPMARPQDILKGMLASHLTHQMGIRFIKELQSNLRLFKF
nr:MAG TPA: hypothetical protein [Caudoviricetes sp.]